MKFWKKIERKIKRYYKKIMKESSIKSENRDLKIENEELRDAIFKLNAQIKKYELDKDVAYVNDLKQSLIIRTRQRNELRKDNDELLYEVKTLKAEVKTLRNDLNLYESEIRGR